MTRVCEVSGYFLTLTAPLLVNRSWTWPIWTVHHGNTHKAILDKAAEIGATAWDFGQVRVLDRS